MPMSKQGLFYDEGEKDTTLFTY